MIRNDFQSLHESISKIDNEILYTNICKNIKKYRLEKYHEFKSKKNNSTINPYSSEKIAELLDYNYNHYKRFESENDSTKRIPLIKLVKLSIILEKNLDDFIK